MKLEEVQISPRWQGTARRDEYSRSNSVHRSPLLTKTEFALEDATRIVPNIQAFSFRYPSNNKFVTMVFNNTKRMDLVKDLLKEERKKKSDRDLKKTPKQRSNRSMKSNEMNTSGHSRTSVTSNSFSSGSFSEEGKNSGIKKDPLHCKNIMKLQKSWEATKQKVDPSTLAEAIVTHMVHIEPQQARQAMKLESLQSERCQEIGDTVIEVLDSMIFLLGPDFDQDDVLDEVDTLNNYGVDIGLLAQALPTAVMECVADMPDKEKALWQKTMPAALQQVNMGQQN